MASKGEIKWSGDLKGKLQGLNGRNVAKMNAIARYVAPQIQADMRNNAKWTDRTGNARNGLFTQVQTTGGQDPTVRIILAHTVPYGVWLEVRWSGKYAIINPSIQKWAPKFFALVAKGMFEGK